MKIKERPLSSLDSKKEQFSAFYLIAHPIKANVVDITQQQFSQTATEFEKQMPYAFKIAGEMSEIQSKALKPLRGLGEKLEDLVTYLQFQAKKIDLMMSFILQQQDDPEYRANAIKFGGGGCVISNSEPVCIGDVKAIKLFLETESAAIYAYGEAIESVKTDDGYELSYVFTHIREQDQELLVRASLHLQTHALRAIHADKDE
ncbi:MAG: hypothetical protein ACJAVV_001034 [Alphaproteobacteria bacterium]|jgi:hypothetical protein